MCALRSSRGGHSATAAPGRMAGGAHARRTSFRRRTGGNSQNYPRVSVGLISEAIEGLSGERVRHD